MAIYLFIFARVGSKGLPGKNIKTLKDKPLIAWSIDIDNLFDFQIAGFLLNINDISV